ncbi:hypothetical protein DXG01_011187 [Tephrocybe rancida]|nr:hypothetical protein DXG01_011187 [Tephrocybe rancida]
MPPCKAAKPTDALERSIDEQLKNLPADKLLACAALAASSGLSADSLVETAATTSSPAKRKLAPADEGIPPSTPSPTKKRAMEDMPVGSAVLQALAGLSANDPDATPIKQSTCLRIPTEKAAAASASKHVIATGPKASSLTRIPDKQEPAEPRLSPPLAIKAASRVHPTARSNTPISLSSSDEDDSMPPVSCLVRGLFLTEGLTTAHADDSQTSSNGGSLASAGYVYDNFIVPDSFDEADHLDASIAARRALNDAPARARRIAQKMIVDDEASEGDAPHPSYNGPQADTSSINLAPVPTTQEANYEDNDDADTNILDLPIMSVKLQDDDMREQGFYDNLPFIEKRAFIDSYGYDKALGDVPRQTSRVARLRSHMTEENMQSLLQALLFVRHGFYVNPGRIELSLLTSNRRCLALKGDGAYATCLMAGIVASCHLADEGILAGTSSFDNKKFLQHRISINPFAQEIVRDTAAIFHTFGLPPSGVRGSYSSGGFVFVTRGQGKRATMNFKGGYVVPKQKASTASDNDLFDVDTVPVRRTFDNNNAMCTVLEYDEAVPIYDGRSETGRPFRFTPADFDALPSWRPYMNHRSDLPCCSIVSVGYSVNWYTLNRDNPNAQRYLSMNVLFVVVLNTPSSLLTKGSGPRDTAPAVDRKGKGRAQA